MKEILLVVHFESGDEIHLTVLDIQHLTTIENFLKVIDVRQKTTDEINEFIEYIHNNKLENIMCQTYVTMDSFQGQYNIKKIIHLPELGM